MSQAGAPRAASVTHQHLLDVMLAHVGSATPGNLLRVLDAGCGDGLLLAFLARGLAWHRPDRVLELHGFDVHDHGVQPKDYFDRTLDLLRTQVPDTPWEQRLALISDRAPWPWPEARFDVVVSNQVLEHVRDHRHFLTQLRRVLRPGGFSVHVFPTRHCWIEPHLHIPFVHRIGTPKGVARYIEVATRLGFGRHDPACESRRAYALRHADYLAHNVNYRSVRELHALGMQSGLEVEFGHTAGLYLTKLRQLLGRSPRPVRAQPPQPPGAPPRGALPYCWLSSVTLVLRRPESGCAENEAIAAPTLRADRSEVPRT